MQPYPGSDFVSGIITAGYLLAGFFFLHFWQRTRDQIFGAFALSFWLLALNDAVAALGHLQEDVSLVYLIRLAAFVVLAVGIMRKNLAELDRFIRTQGPAPSDRRSREGPDGPGGPAPPRTP